MLQHLEFFGYFFKEEKNIVTVKVLKNEYLGF